MSTRKPGYAALLGRLIGDQASDEGVAMIRVPSNGAAQPKRTISLGERRLQNVLDVALSGSAAEGMDVAEQIRVVLAVRERQQSRATLM